jgi:uncharacterized membrane protein YkoI
MRSRTKVALVAGALALGAAGIATAVGASSNDDREAPITGVAFEQASQAALAYTGGGRVTETEVGDEDSYYEVEVTLDDGSQVDVQLDANFAVVGSEVDHEDGADDANDRADD